jgi:hypothetical protein
MSISIGKQTRITSGPQKKRACQFGRLAVKYSAVAMESDFRQPGWKPQLLNFLEDTLAEYPLRN